MYQAELPSPQAPCLLTKKQELRQKFSNRSQPHRKGGGGGVVPLAPRSSVSRPRGSLPANGGGGGGCGRGCGGVCGSVCVPVSPPEGDGEVCRGR